MTPEDPSDTFPPRWCRTCEAWKPHTEFEVTARSGKDKGRVLVRPDCADCRARYRGALIERVRAARGRGQKPPLREGPKPVPPSTQERRPNPVTGFKYTYLGKLPALLHACFQTGFYLGRATATKGMRRKIAFRSYYRYRKLLIAALEAAREKAKEQKQPERATPSREEEEWERMTKEVEALSRKLGGEA
jgi:hypothetical protein